MDQAWFDLCLFCKPNLGLVKEIKPNGPGLQALRYKIWDLGLASKSHYKGKIWAFGTKLGLFWDHFWTFPGLLSRYFHENAKNVQKGQKNALSRHFPLQNISNGQ